MRILVTGGGGYIGSALSIELAKQGHEMTVIDHFCHGYDSHDPLTELGIAVWNKNLFFSDYPFLFENKDVIFHLAAIAGSKACDEAGSELVQKYNVDITDKLVQRITNELFIFASTSAVYGEESFYTRSKSEAEMALLKCKNFIAIRLPTIFGISPCMRKNILVHDLVKSAVHDGYIVLWDEDSMRTWMSLKDCISGLISLINRFDKSNNKIWDIDGHFYTKKQIAGTIRNFTGCEIFYSNRKEKYVQNFNKIQMPRFRYNLSAFETLKELVEYYEGTKHSSAIDWSK